MWSVALNGEPVDTTGFLASERLDLRMRGVIGLVPLAGVEPGVQVLQVTWNPDAMADDIPMDDRYSQAKFEYQIPFVFAPEYEREFEESGHATASQAPGE
jgi:hypothetical protein